MYTLTIKQNKQKSKLDSLNALKRFSVARGRPENHTSWGKKLRGLNYVCTIEFILGLFFTKMTLQYNYDYSLSYYLLFVCQLKKPTNQNLTVSDSSKIWLL